MTAVAGAGIRPSIGSAQRLRPDPPRSEVPGILGRAHSTDAFSLVPATDPMSHPTSSTFSSGDATRGRDYRAALATFLSFLFPGAGQPYNHQPRLALAFAGPVLFLAATSSDALLPQLLDRRVIIGLLVVNGLVLIWRLASVIQAHRRRAAFRPSSIGTVATPALVLVAILKRGRRRRGRSG